MRARYKYIGQIFWDLIIKKFKYRYSIVKKEPILNSKPVKGSYAFWDVVIFPKT